MVFLSFGSCTIGIYHLRGQSIQAQLVQQKIRALARSPLAIVVYTASRNALDKPAPFDPCSDLLEGSHNIGREPQLEGAILEGMTME